MNKLDKFNFFGCTGIPSSRRKSREKTGSPGWGVGNLRERQQIDCPSEIGPTRTVNYRPDSSSDRTLHNYKPATT
jgi:hypothetical protein